MTEDTSKRDAQTEKLVDFLFFFREKFDLPDTPVRQSSKIGNKYNFPRLPNFSTLNELFTPENGLDFCYKTYKANKTIIKEIQKKQQHQDIKRLLSYLQYMKKQESKTHIYLTHTERTKNEYITGLKEFIKKLEPYFDLKILRYSADINNNKTFSSFGIDEKSVERYVKDISCIIQNINKGIFPGIFTESDLLPCLKFFTNGKIQYFCDKVYSYPIPILRLIPDRGMSVLHAREQNFTAHYLEKIVSKNNDIINKILINQKQNTVGRKRTDDRTIFCAVLYKFWTDTKWEELPAVYPDINYTRCKKRKSEWAKDGTFRRIRNELRASPKCPDGKRPSDIRRLSLLLKKL